MKKAFLLIGGNIGDRLYHLTQAKKLIEQDCGHIVICSSVYETAAWGKTDQPSFLNQVLIIQTRLDAFSLLNAILKIETSMGRKRMEKYDARTIDIDILYYESEQMNIESLNIPHPKISERRFVLTPLAELAPDMIDPCHRKSIKVLLAECPDTLDVHVFNIQNADNQT